MDLSSAVPGDRIKISLDGKSNEFEVILAEDREIVVSPIGNPSSQTGLFRTSAGWKIVGAEKVNYQFELIPQSQAPSLPAPVPSPAPTPSPAPVPVKSPRKMSDDNAAKICSQLILNPKSQVESSDLEKLSEYAATAGFGKLEDNLRSKRDICEKVLQKVVQAQNPDLNVQRINVQNLARQYQSSQAQQIERQAQAEKEALAKAEREAKEQEDRRKQARLKSLQEARQEAIQDRSKFIRRSATIRSSCLRAGKFIYGFSNYRVFVDPELIGRRVRLPENQWQKIFSEAEEHLVPAGEQAPANLIDNPLIQEALMEIIGPDFMEMGLDNQGVVELLGQDMVQALAPEFQAAPRPIHAQFYLKIDIAEPIYAVIEGPHADGEDILFVSQQLEGEFERIYNPKVTRVTECSLHPIKELNIELLRFPELESADVNEDVLKNLLIDKIVEYGILIAGDILTLEVDKYSFKYLIKKITNTEDQVVYAAGVPQVIQDIRVLLDIQSKEQAKEMIESRYTGEIDLDYI